MTVTYKGEDPAGRTATNTRGVRTYTRVFKFETSVATEDAWDVGSHLSAPSIGNSFRDAWCVSVSVANNNPWKGWIVTGEYSNEREYATNPMLDPAVVTVNTEQFQKVADRDKDGYSICNSAGDPFDPPYMMDDSRRVVTVSRNMSGHPSWLLSYADAVNNDNFSVKGGFYNVGQGKVQRVSIGDQQVRNGIPFVNVSFDIHLQRDGWILKPLDAGFRKKVGTTRLNITNDGDGNQPTSPVPLDGAGAVLANPTTTNAVYGSFTVYKTLPFSALPLT